MGMGMDPHGHMDGRATCFYVKCPHALKSTNTCICVLALLNSQIVLRSSDALHSVCHARNAVVWKKSVGFIGGGGMPTLNWQFGTPTVLLSNGD